jgi:5-formyltetrahydrofolate cyclo-ligase
LFIELIGDNINRFQEGDFPQKMVKVDTQTKQALRLRMLDNIQRQKEEDALGKSRAIQDKLFALPVFVRARTICCYVSFKGEVDTFAVMARAIELGKRVAVPFVIKGSKKILPIVITSIDELSAGTYGIPEPPFEAGRVLKPASLDLVVVPGVAFDRQHNRLGRGAGYYDRFLAELPDTTPTVGLAYDLQIVDTLPGTEPHDKPLTLVLSN